MLGGLSVSLGDASHQRFRSRSAAALLAYLALHSPTPQTRDHLCDLLWPDESLAVARNRLRVDLASLRKLLDGGPGASPIVADRSAIGLDADAVEVDLAEYRNLLATARRETSVGEQIRCLTEADALYGGDLLPGWYEDWVERERQILAEERMATLAHLVRLLIQQGDFERAIEYGRLATRADPLREEAVRDLVQLQAASGRLTAALNEYHVYERLLRETIGAEPSAGLKRIKDQVVVRLGRDVDPPATARRTREAESGAAAHTGVATRLPRPVTRLFGREALAERVLAALAQPEAPGPIISLTGIGGVGKTRLAIEVATAYDRAGHGPACFVALADVREPRQIPAAVAEALGAPVDSEQDPMTAIAEQSRGSGARRTLLVLDNLEQLLPDGAEQIERLRWAAPQLRLLTTTRRGLAIDGEREIAITPLALPSASDRGDADRIELSPCVQLFLDRARAVRADFALTDANAGAIAELCRQLEGLPLAIEIAAAQSRSYAAAEILAGIARGEDLLVDRRAHKDSRHRSFRAALEWSSRLLAPPLRQTLARLSVFHGGWTREAAQALCPDTDVTGHLDTLVAHSLVQASASGGRMRFTMLALVRAFAAEQLPEAEMRIVGDRHADYFLSFVEEMGGWQKDPTRPEHVASLDPERDNVLAAVEWLQQHDAGGDRDLRLTTALLWFWVRRGRLREGAERLGAAIEASRRRTDASDLSRAWARSSRGLLLCYLDVFGEALEEFTQSLALMERVGDAVAIGRVKAGMGFALHGTGNYARAREFLEIGLKDARRRGDAWAEGCDLNLLGFGACFEGRYADARRSFEESLVAYHRSGGDDFWSSHSLLGLARVAWRERDLAGARAYYLECLERFAGNGDRRGTIYAIEGLGRVAAAEAEPVRALKLLASASALREATGMLRDAPDQEEYDAAAGTARAALPYRDWSQAWQAGRALTLEETIALARDGAVHEAPAPG